MALVSIASADSITVLAPVCEISGTTTINTILGVKDGQVLKVWPTGTWAFGAAGNIVASTVAQVSGTPVFLFQRNGVLTQVGVRPDSPTLVTPTIASFANAAHTHQDAAGGGQLAAAALSDGTTGTGAFVRTATPTIDSLVITTHVRLPGPVYIYAGSGTPEGNVAAPVGSLYMRDNGGGGTTGYAKTSGSGDTGWTAFV